MIVIHFTAVKVQFIFIFFQLIKIDDSKNKMLVNDLTIISIDFLFSLKTLLEVRKFR